MRQICLLTLFSLTFILTSNAAELTLLDSKEPIYRPGTTREINTGDTLPVEGGIRTTMANRYTASAGDELLIKTVPCPVCGRNDLSVKEAGYSEVGLELSHGGVLADLKPKHSLTSFKIMSPVAVASVRGTRFWSHVHHNGEEIIAVKEGRVMVKPANSYARWVHAGETLAITSDGSNSKKRSITVYERDTLNQLTDSHF